MFRIKRGVGRKGEMHEENIEVVRKKIYGFLGGWWGVYVWFMRRKKIFYAGKKIIKEEEKQKRWGQPEKEGEYEVITSNVGIFLQQREEFYRKHGKRARKRKKSGKKGE